MEGRNHGHPHRALFLTVLRCANDFQRPDRFVRLKCIDFLDHHRRYLLVRVGRFGVNRFEDFPMIWNEEKSETVRVND